MVCYPPLRLSFTQAHLCDTPFDDISRNNCGIPYKKQTRKSFVIASATSLARYKKYRCWASKTVRDFGALSAAAQFPISRIWRKSALEEDWGPVRHQRVSWGLQPQDIPRV